MGGACSFETSANVYMPAGLISKNKTYFSFKQLEFFAGVVTQSNNGVAVGSG
jgi:hypothetical protein